MSSKSRTTYGQRTMIDSPSSWEGIYSGGHQLNRYPFDVVISYVMRNFGHLNQHERSKIRFLEVGCGAGNNIWFLQREGFLASGIDQSKTAIDFATDRLTADGMMADLVIGDFSSLPWPDRSFDCIIDRGSITHNDRATIQRSLTEAHRVLKPRGYFFSQMFSSEDDRRTTADCGATFFATEDDLKDLYSSLFSIETREHRVITDDHGRTAMWNLGLRKRLDKAL